MTSAWRRVGRFFNADFPGLDGLWPPPTVCRAGAMPANVPANTRWTAGDLWKGHSRRTLPTKYAFRPP